MIQLYGIANCDKVKASRTWLERAGLDYAFHDFRQQGLERAQAERWYNALGDALINRRSTSWRQLSPKQQAMRDRQAVLELILQQPTLIQRPVLERGERLLINFSPDRYAEFFTKDLP